MPQVMINCPKTGNPISTQMNMDQRSFDTATLSQNSVDCPECRQTHTWDKKDAFLEGEEKSKAQKQ